MHESRYVVSDSKTAIRPPIIAANVQRLIGTRGLESPAEAGVITSVRYDFEVLVRR